MVEYNIFYTYKSFIKHDNIPLKSIQSNESVLELIVVISYLSHNCYIELVMLKKWKKQVAKMESEELSSKISEIIG